MMREANLTDLELAEIDMDALFTHDERGRMVAVNEPGGTVAPRFIFGRTGQGNVWRVRYDLPEPVVQQLADQAASEPVRQDLAELPVHLDAMRETLRAGGASGEPERELSYRFPREIAVPELAGVTRITRDTIPLLWRMAPDLADVERTFEQGEPCVVVLADAAAVSLCYSSRLTDRAAEAGLETLEEYRGRGYGPAVVAAWARAVRDSGRVPIYSTSWDNTASQAVARKLGLRQFAAMLSFP